MTSIYDIPYGDVKKFLLFNNMIFKARDKAYNKTLLLLGDKSTKGHTTSIIEWMIAYNLLIHKVDINFYTYEEINDMEQQQIDKLSKLLTMKGNNKSNIKNILGYMNKLVYFDILPTEIKIEILGKADINEINKLSILSRDFKKVCESKDVRSLLIHKFSNNDNLDISNYTNIELIRYYQIVLYKKKHSFYDNKKQNLPSYLQNEEDLLEINQIIMPYDHGLIILCSNGKLYRDLIGLNFHSCSEQVTDFSRICGLFPAKVINKTIAVIFVTSEGDYYFLNSKWQYFSLKKNLVRIKKYISGTYQLTDKEVDLCLSDKEVGVYLSRDHY